MVGEPRFGKAAPERTTLDCYSALQTTAASCSASKPHYKEVCVASFKTISSVGECRGPFLTAELWRRRGRFSYRYLRHSCGLGLEQRTGGQGLVELLGHATSSRRHHQPTGLWPYRKRPIWPGCNISAQRLLTRVQHADESRPNGTDSQAHSGYQWLAGLRLLTALCRNDVAGESPVQHISLQPPYD